MATELPTDPNTGGTGLSSPYQTIAPSFLGGQTDPNTGIIIPSNANQAASAPSPASSIAPQQTPGPAPGPAGGTAPTTSTTGSTGASIPTPQIPTTQLGQVSATPVPQPTASAPSSLETYGLLGAAALAPSVASGASSALGLPSASQAFSGIKNALTGSSSPSLDSLATNSAVNTANVNAAADGLAPLSVGSSEASAGTLDGITTGAYVQAATAPPLDLGAAASGAATSAAADTGAATAAATDVAASVAPEAVDVAASAAPAATDVAASAAPAAVDAWSGFLDFLGGLFSFL